jgi:ABC-type nitrate/sulfonate/bicarbonate transport system permease component
LPALKRYFIPAFITAIGLAFKAEIAAEIIVGGVTNCIGVMIYRAKDVPATDEVFAWTVIGIFFSILLESLAKMLLKATYRENSEVKS